jgi:hypothetical protein
MLTQEHPDLFAKAVDYEQNHRDGRTYTWTQGETLQELIARREEILADHERAIARRQDLGKRSLAQVLEEVLEEEEEELPCLACHL